MRRHIRKVLSLKSEILIALLILGLILASWAVLWLASLKLPDLNSFGSRIVSQSTKIYDRTGSVLLYDINEGIRRTVLKSEDISRNIKNATVAIEDSEFYEHRGVRPLSFLRAVFVNLRSVGYSQGGSTITQQVIKNALLTTEKSIGRKLKEWILSVKLEGEMSKDNILALYLNDSPYGGNIYGIEEASKTFFGKKASEVTLSEAAYLAALPNAPSYFSPYGGNRKALEERKNLVLSKMLEKEFISEEEYKKAKEEVVNFNQAENFGIKAPHFVMYVKSELEKMFGQNVLQSGGYKVTTTLNYDLQKKAEEITKTFATENSKNYNASNGAMVAIDAPTGEILTMVGSRDYFDQEIDGNFNIITAHRQPGSSFKPFVYATALQKGYTPETVLFDLPTEFSSECNPDGTPIKPIDEEKCYMPENYDGKYRGPISLREALAQSINIPAIKVLYLSGIRNAINLANRMGIKSLNDPDRYGLTLVLGGGEVSPLEMTSAYGVFANEGIRIEEHGILKIEDSSGSNIYTFKAEPKQALDTETARQITDILSDNEARAPSYGYISPLHFRGYDVAAKTGTTNDYRDAWIIGYTPRIAVGAWVGNNDNSPMEKKVAGFMVAPMWNAFMQEVLKSNPIQKFNSPYEQISMELKPVLRGKWQGGESYFIDSRNGQIANESTPEEYLKEEIIPNVHSILYWVDKNEPLGPKPTSPEKDSQFYLWEYPIQKWVSENNINMTLQNSLIKKSPEPVLPKVPEKIAPISISLVSPDQRTKYLPQDKVTISIVTVGSVSPIKVEFYVNGQYIGSAMSAPFGISFVPKEIGLLQKYNNVKVVAYGPNGEKTQTSASFTVDF